MLTTMISSDPAHSELQRLYDPLALAGNNGLWAEYPAAVSPARRDRQEQGGVSFRIHIPIMGASIRVSVETD